MPLLLFFVLISGVAICLFNPEPRVSLKTGLHSIFGISNIYLNIRATDYFGESSGLNIFTHTWSLGVEEQFYLVFPFLFGFLGLEDKQKMVIVIFNNFWNFSNFIFNRFFLSIFCSTANRLFFCAIEVLEMATGCLLFVVLKIII